MLAKEFIIEKQVKVDPMHASASPGAYSSTVDRYYGLYRASMLMACSPGDLSKIDTSSASGDKLYVGAYTDAEKNMIDSAFKAMGAKVITYASPPSHEEKDIQITSPVQPFKGY